MNHVIDVHPLWDQEFDEGMVSKLAGTGHYHIEVWRLNLDNVLELYRVLDFHNGIVTAGLNLMLNVMFASGTATANWYLLPISSSGYTSLSSSDTMAAHTGWQESIAYGEATRQQWGAGSATGGSITNASQAVFTINADSTTWVGLALCGNSAKSSNTGPLWATGLFPSAQTFNSGDVVKINYVVNLTATN